MRQWNPFDMIRTQIAKISKNALGIVTNFDYALTQILEACSGCNDVMLFLLKILGSVAGALANKFGCRAVAIAGSAWAATAFFLSTFSPNVDSLILLYGALGGEYIFIRCFHKYTDSWQYWHYCQLCNPKYFLFLFLPISKCEIDFSRYTP